MSTRKALSVISGLALGIAMLVPAAARADTYNQSSQLTFNQPIEMPGNTVLPAGTYWFQLFNTRGTRQIVQIFNANHSKLLATYLAVATERMVPRDHTVVKLINQPRNRPYALLSWFYPDRLIGHEFVFSPNQAKSLSEQTIVSVTARTANSSGNLIAMGKTQQGLQAQTAVG